MTGIPKYVNQIVRSWVTGLCYSHSCISLTHRGRVICVSKLNLHLFRLGLVACSAPYHYQHQCWQIVNWNLGNMLSWNSNNAVFIDEKEFAILVSKTLQWRHNELDTYLKHQPHDCLLNLLFRFRSKKTSKLRVTGICAWNSPVTGEFPAQRASNAGNVSIWWRHHVSAILFRLQYDTELYAMSYCVLLCYLSTGGMTYIFKEIYKA